MRLVSVKSRKLPFSGYIHCGWIRYDYRPIIELDAEIRITDNY